MSMVRIREREGGGVHSLLRIFFVCVFVCVCIYVCVFVRVCVLKGINHKIRFTCCACEPLVVTLARARLWPATPSNPRFAFSFALLDLAEALLLECQVAIKDYCSALRFRNPFPEVKVH